MMVVNNNNYNTSNKSVNNQTDVHSGKLDTGIDSYFDKNESQLRLIVNIFQGLFR